MPLVMSKVFPSYLCIAFIFFILLIRFPTKIVAQQAGPVAAYDLSEGVGTVVRDASGHNNHGTILGDANWTDAGRYGNAISFHGNGYINVADSPLLYLGQGGTLEAWVSLSIVDQWNGILAKGSGNSPQAKNYSMEITPDNTVQCILGNGSGFTTIESLNALSDGVFYHLACTWDGATVSIYINGVLDSSVSQEAEPAVNSGPLYIGQFAPDVGGINGVIDDVRIYNRALTEQEINLDINTPVTPPEAITIIPNKVRFDSVLIGVSSTQTITLRNAGTSDVMIKESHVDNAAFTWSGPTLPFTIGAGQSQFLIVHFTPTVVGLARGLLTLTFSAVTPPLTIDLGGFGIAATQELTAAPATLSFGDVVLASSSTRTATLANIGNRDIRISSVTVAGSAAFRIFDIPLVTLSPGQSASLGVMFVPSLLGEVTGTIKIESNAGAATITINGSGIQSADHSVTLSWSPSTSTVKGYNIYRSTSPGGPYSRLNSTPIEGTTFSDKSLPSGASYYYVVTAMDFDDLESDFSNETSATVP